MIWIILLLVVALGASVFYNVVLRSERDAALAIGALARSESMQAVQEAAAVEGLDFELIKRMIEQKVTPSVDAIMAGRERAHQQSEGIRQVHG